MYSSSCFFSGKVAQHLVQSWVVRFISPVWRTLNWFYMLCSLFIIVGLGAVSLAGKYQKTIWWCLYDGRKGIVKIPIQWLYVLTWQHTDYKNGFQSLPELPGTYFSSFIVNIWLDTGFGFYLTPGLDISGTHTHTLKNTHCPLCGKASYWLT